MNKQSGRIGLYLVLIVALIAGYLYLNNQVAVQSDYTYGQLEQAVTDGKVTSATIHQNSEVPTGSVIVNISGEGQKRIYVADVNEAEQLLRESGLDPAVEDVPKQSVFMNSVFPVLLTCGLIIFLMLMMNRQMSGGGGGTNAKMMNFGKSRARMSMPDDKKVTFQNVAGLEEEKEELKEVVDFLKDPQKYTKVGARIPKGVILVGPPGPTTTSPAASPSPPLPVVCTSTLWARNAENWERPPRDPTSPGVPNHPSLWLGIIERTGGVSAVPETTPGTWDETNSPRSCSLRFPRSAPQYRTCGAEFSAIWRTTDVPPARR